ncbi:MAG: FtsX-like permease family protein [Anaerovoracaceae bacterium]|jgi:putative ABC transport system permease protein
MKIIGRLTSETMRTRKTMTVVVILGVFLSTMLMSGVLLFASCLQNYMVDTYAEHDGDWYAAAFGVHSRKTVKKLYSDERTAAAVSLKTVGYADDGVGNRDSKPYLYLAQANKKLMKQLNIKLEEGRLPEKPWEIVMPANRMANGRALYDVGDNVPLKVGRRVSADGKDLYQNSSYKAGEKLINLKRRTFLVVGVMDTPQGEPYQAAGETAFTAPNDKDTGIYTVFVKTENPRSIRSYVAEHFAGYQIDYNDNLLKIQGALGIDRSMKIIIAGIMLLLGLISLGAVVLIYNAFSISVTNRRRQLGMLSSVGATGRQLKKITMGEGLLICLAGIPSGLLAGIGAVAVIIGLLSDSFRQLIGPDQAAQLHLHVTGAPLLMAALLTLVVVMISVWFPARKAGKMTVMEMIRQQREDQMIKRRRDGIFGRLAGRLFGLPGKLVARYYSRDRIKYVGPVISVFLSIVLFVSAYAFSGLLNAEVAHNFKTVNDYDISYTTLVHNSTPDIGQDRLDYVKLQEAEGVTASSFNEIIVGRVTVPRKDIGNEDLTGSIKTRKIGVGILVVENKSFRDLAGRINARSSDILCNANSRVSGNYSDIAALGDALEYNNGKLTISLGNKVTRTIRINLATSSVPWGCSDYRDSAHIIMSESKAVRVLGNYEKFVTGRLMCFKSNKPLEAFESLKHICSQQDMNTDNLYDKYSDGNAYRALILIVQILAFGFIIIISLVSIANVANTVTTNISLRAGDLAMLQMLGMDRRDSHIMIDLECMIYGLQGLLLGIPAAIAISIFLSYNIDIPGVGIYIPWKGIAIGVVSVLFVVLVTVIYATSKLKKNDAMETLRRNNI